MFEDGVGGGRTNRLCGNYDKNPVQKCYDKMSNFNNFSVFHIPFMVELIKHSVDLIYSFQLVVHLLFAKSLSFRFPTTTASTIWSSTRYETVSCIFLKLRLSKFSNVIAVQYKIYVEHTLKTIDKSRVYRWSLLIFGQLANKLLLCQRKVNIFAATWISSVLTWNVDRIYIVIHAKKKSG